MTKKIQQVHYKYLSSSGILFISSKCNTSGIHFYTSWFCKITCVSLLPGDLVSTAELLNPSFLSSSSSSFKHFSPPHTPSPTQTENHARTGTLPSAPAARKAGDREPCTLPSSPAANPSNQHHPKNPATDIKSTFNLPLQHLILWAWCSASS